MSYRSFLLLQGVASPFFSELEKALNDAGEKALKINFCGGDLVSGRFFSTALKRISFRDKIEDLPEFYEEIFAEHNITDIILFGDTRPVHTPAIKLAKEKNITVHVYEEGYLRPNWVTLETGGVNANSSLPKDPQWYLNNAPTLRKTSKSTGGGLAIRAWHDIRFHLAKSLLKSFFPHYKTHRPDHFSKEYWGFIKRIPSLKFYFNKQASNRINKLISSQRPFYVLPLQLDADSQIRLHSSVGNVSRVIQETIKSFANHAKSNTILVIKNHPLDPWFVDFPEVIKKAAKDNNLDMSRILYLEAGNLELLLEKAKGTVLVNSTVGTLSLAANCPVIALGNAIYDMPLLTFQGSLNDFWSHATPPNKELFKAFRSYVIEKTQINGSFYNKKGIKMAIENSLPSLGIELKTQIGKTAPTPIATKTASASGLVSD